MSGFGEHAFAGQFRDIIEQVTVGVINRIRPDTIIGKVYSFDVATQKAYVLLPGETVNSLIVVRFALDKIPQVSMDATYKALGYQATSDVVRIAGKAGAYYILDYVYGEPAPRAAASNDTGWITFSKFGAGVAQYGDIWQYAQYRRQGTHCYARGLLAVPTVGARFAIVQVDRTDCRPLKANVNDVDANDVAKRFDIMTNGDIVGNTSINSGYVSLSGLEWWTD